MSTDLFDRYASLDPANNPQAAPDWASTAHVPLAAIDERTTRMQTEARTQDAVVSTTPPRRSRNGMLVAAAVFAIVVIAGAVLAIISLRGEPQPAAPTPEEIVAQVIEASNRRDSEAFAALYDPNIIYSYNADQIGASAYNIRRSGREDVLESLERVWATFGPVVSSYEVLEVDGAVVTTAENVRLEGGGARHVVTYEVSADGLVVRQEHIVQG